MDLREKPGVQQKIASWVLRFRFPLLFLLVGAWWFLSPEVVASVSAILGQAEWNAQTLAYWLSGSFEQSQNWLHFALVALLIALIRGVLTEWLLGLGSFLMLLLLFFVCFLLDGSQEVFPVIMGAGFMIALALTMFGKKIRFILVLPGAILFAFLITWMTGQPVAIGIGNQYLAALLLIDVIFMGKCMASEMEKGRQKQAAVVTAFQKQFLSTGVTLLILVIAEVVLTFAYQTGIWAGAASAVALTLAGYALTSLVLAPIIFSLSPIGRLQAKKRKI